MPKRDKKLIGQRFAQSRDYYLSHAYVQRQTAKLLVNYLLTLCGNKFERIFEIGCGNGLLTEIIASHIDYNQLFINDLVEQYQEVAKEKTNCEFLSGDIEHMANLPDRLDLAISNATFQWLDDIESFLGRLADCIRSGKFLAFSTFGVGNMHEIAELTGISLDYLSADAWKDVVSRNFDIIKFDCYTQTLEFRHPLDVLKHLKLTGVTGISQKTWTRNSLRKFSEQYLNRFKIGDVVTLTYCPIVVVAVKK